MSRDKSLTGVASVGDQGIALDSPNTDTISVPDGSIWFVDGVFVDGEEPIRSAIIVDPDNTSPQAPSLWSQATDFSGPYSVFESDGTVYVADRDGGSVDALNAADGTRQWSQATDFNTPRSVFESDGTVYVADRNGGSVDALNAADGTRQWSQATDFSSPQSVFESNGTVYVADRDGGSVDALVTTALSSASRSTESIGSTELGEYAYGGDTIAVGVNLPQQSVGYRLGVREVVSQ